MLESFRRRVAGWLDPKAESRSVQLGISPRIDPSNLLGSLGGRPTVAGVKINPASALGITAFWSGVNLIASTIATCRFEAGREERRDEFIPDRSDPRYDLLRRRPNRTTPKFHFWQSLIVHALTYKGGFAEIEWSARGRQALGLHIMDPRTTEAIVLSDRSVEYRYDASDHRLASSDVLHIRGLCFDGVRGYSLVDLAAETLGVSKAQLLYQGALYGNGAMASGYFEVPGNKTPIQLAQDRAEIEKVHGGASNGGKFGFLTGGTKFVPVSYSPVDAQMSVAQEAMVAQIALLLRIPPHMFGIMKGATVGNAEEQAAQFIKFTLLPYFEAIEGEVDLKLYSPQERNRGLCTRHGTRALERGNMAARIAYYQGRFALGSITPDEIRVAEGDIPFDIPAANDAYIPTNNLTALRFVVGKPTQPASSAPKTDSKTDDPEPAADGKQSPPVPAG